MLKPLVDVSYNTPVLFLFRGIELTIAEESIFHFWSASGNKKETLSPKGFNCTFGGWFWHFYQQNQAVFWQLLESTASRKQKRLGLLLFGAFSIISNVLRISFGRIILLEDY